MNSKYKVDNLDLLMLKRIDGLRYRTEVEFEEKTRLRSLMAYGVKSSINENGTVNIDFESFTS